MSIRKRRSPSPALPVYEFINSGDDEAADSDYTPRLIHKSSQASSLTDTVNESTTSSSSCIIVDPTTPTPRLLVTTAPSHSLLSRRVRSHTSWIFQYGYQQERNGGIWWYCSICKSLSSLISTWVMDHI